MSPELSLVIQYGIPVPDLPRWRLRRWVAKALQQWSMQIGRFHYGPNEPVAAVALTLRLVDAEEGCELNTRFRERDYATNVLTFEYGTDPDGTAHGDIVLCVPVLAAEAAEQGKPWLHHAAHLTVHGTLHALGFDHIAPGQADEMEALETAILAALGIPDPYTPTT